LASTADIRMLVAMMSTSEPHERKRASLKGRAASGAKGAKGERGFMGCAGLPAA
jgi:hypothetical protein